jgi:hypothetical protein
VDDIEQVSQEKKAYLLNPSRLMRLGGQFSKWNITKHQGQMDFRQNFIRHVGRSLK